ncbi:MAG TPA: hypothetical protein VMW36_01130 [Patescibacteria group bacterium]|nr:hypothetical protein [Patescibacteria group bacterium]
MSSLTKFSFLMSNNGLDMYSVSSCMVTKLISGVQACAIQSTVRKMEDTEYKIIECGDTLIVTLVSQIQESKEVYLLVVTDDGNVGWIRSEYVDLEISL